MIDAHMAHQTDIRIQTLLVMFRNIKKAQNEQERMRERDRGRTKRDRKWICVNTPLTHVPGVKMANKAF